MNEDPTDIILKIGKYDFSPKSKTLILEGVTTKLSTRESKVMEFLVRYLNQTAPRKDMVTSIWGAYDVKNGRSMDVFISRLRKHLKLDKSIQIINVFGKGFSLTVKKDKPLSIFR